MEIRDRTFLVTGAGSGLGAATASKLALLGANVVVADVEEEAGAQTVASIGESALFVRCDVTSEEDVQAALKAAVDTTGAVHGLVNCAGILLGRRTVGRKGPHDLASFERVIKVNLIGTFNAIRLSAVAMADNEPGEDGERGVIVNTASVAAFDGQVGQAAYSASKGGVVGMTLPLARDLAVTGVRVVTIAPGIFDTAMMQAAPDNVRDSLAAQIPFPRRFGDPAEYAALACHIIENRMLNGEVIRLDGAVRMAPR